MPLCATGVSDGSKNLHRISILNILAIPGIKSRGRKNRVATNSRDFRGLPHIVAIAIAVI